MYIGILEYSSVCNNFFSPHIPLSIDFILIVFSKFLVLTSSNHFSPCLPKWYKTVFFKLDLPVIGSLTTFRIKGETESIYFADESTTCS